MTKTGDDLVQQLTAYTIFFPTDNDIYDQLKLICTMGLGFTTMLAALSVPMTREQNSKLDSVVVSHPSINLCLNFYLISLEPFFFLSSWMISLRSSSNQLEGVLLEGQSNNQKTMSL